MRILCKPHFFNATVILTNAARLHRRLRLSMLNIRNGVGKFIPPVVIDEIICYTVDTDNESEFYNRSKAV